MDKQKNDNAWLKLYRSASLCLSLIFAIVGLIFLFIPDDVFLLFNSVSRLIGYPESSLQSFGLYQVLAVGYMYLVTLLAYYMNKYPENRFFPLLLIHGKSASSLLSLCLFFVHPPCLLLLTNGIVDGMIAIGVFVLYKKSRQTRQ
jgi:uncharacterized protein YjeT (DUF2065 family)